MCPLSPCYTRTEIFHLFDSKSQTDDVKCLILHHPVDFWQRFVKGKDCFAHRQSHRVQSIIGVEVSLLFGKSEFKYMLCQHGSLECTVCFAVLTIHLSTIKLRHFHNHFKLIINQTVNLKRLWKFLTLVSPWANCSRFEIKPQKKWHLVAGRLI